MTQPEETSSYCRDTGRTTVKLVVDMNAILPPDPVARAGWIEQFGPVNDFMFVQASALLQRWALAGCTITPGGAVMHMPAALRVALRTAGSDLVRERGTAGHHRERSAPNDTTITLDDDFVEVQLADAIAAKAAGSALRAEPDIKRLLVPPVPPNTTGSNPDTAA